MRWSGSRWSAFLPEDSQIRFHEERTSLVSSLLRSLSRQSQTLRGCHVAGSSNAHGLCGGNSAELPQIYAIFYAIKDGHVGLELRNVDINYPFENLILPAMKMSGLRQSPQTRLIAGRHLECR